MVPMLWKIFLLVGCAHGSPYLDKLSCPQCEPEFCPKNSSECPLGATPDRCGCCAVGVCLLSVGDRCLNTLTTSALSQTDLRRYGTCGDSMVCRERTDLDPRLEMRESTCVCLDRNPVCGSNNKTYESTCALQDAQKILQNSQKIGHKKALVLAHPGPCAEAPRIAVGPVSNSHFLDDSLAMDCEVHGVPVPSVAWEFQGLDGSRKLLPGDDSSIVVQSRGGPELSMVTSWVQIVSIRPEDAGTYTCTASNRHGEARQSAEINLQMVQ